MYINSMQGHAPDDIVFKGTETWKQINMYSIPTKVT